MGRACEGSSLILFFLLDLLRWNPPTVAVTTSTPRSAANPEDAWILEDDLGNWLAGRETQYTEAMVEGNKVSPAVCVGGYRLPPEREPSGASC